MLCKHFDLLIQKLDANVKKYSNFETRYRDLSFMVFSDYTSTYKELTKHYQQTAKILKETSLLSIKTAGDKNLNKNGFGTVNEIIETVEKNIEDSSW